MIELTKGSARNKKSHRRLNSNVQGSHYPRKELTELFRGKEMRMTRGMTKTAMKMRYKKKARTES